MRLAFLNIKLTTELKFIMIKLVINYNALPQLLLNRKPIKIVPLYSYKNSGMVMWQQIQYFENNILYFCEQPCGRLDD